MFVYVCLSPISLAEPKRMGSWLLIFAFLIYSAVLIPKKNSKRICEMSKQVIGHNFTTETCDLIYSN